MTTFFVLAQRSPANVYPDLGYSRRINYKIFQNTKCYSSKVKLVICDLLGREVTTLVNEELKPGTYETDWDGSNYSSGIYFFKLVTIDYSLTRKMVLMK